tara:strand:+ start:836 stop:1009 length:174 start_codon:yes stop_codon:yes gene_type:complete
MTCWTRTETDRALLNKILKAVTKLGEPVQDGMIKHFNQRISDSKMIQELTNDIKPKE